MAKVRWRVRAELRDACGQAIEHVALRLAEADEIGARLLDIFDIDRIARDPALAQRHVDDAQRAPRAADRRGQRALGRVPGIARGRRGGERACRPLPLDQLQPARDHVARAAAVHRLDIR